MVKKIQKDRLKEKFIKISTKEGKLFICLNLLPLSFSSFLFSLSQKQTRYQYRERNRTKQTYLSLRDRFDSRATFFMAYSAITKSSTEISRLEFEK
jgi:hypothetical protein